jgi:hypothetical protein
MTEKSAFEAATAVMQWTVNERSKAPRADQSIIILYGFSFAGAICAYLAPLYAGSVQPTPRLLAYDLRRSPVSCSTTPGHREVNCSAISFPSRQPALRLLLATSTRPTSRSSRFTTRPAFSCRQGRIAGSIHYTWIIYSHVVHLRKNAS